MPSRTRAAKTTKGLKENIGAVVKRKLKSVEKPTKKPRKALADKTNSASDDNASHEVPKKVERKPHKVTKPSKNENKTSNECRPRRERRLPNRFVENPSFTTLSKSSENVAITLNSKASKTNASDIASPFKTPKKNIESSPVVRPKRVHRLPSRFEDHSISPSKFVPLQPCHASTPLVQNNKKPSKVTNKEDSGIKEGSSEAKKDVTTKKTVRVPANTNNNKNKEIKSKSPNKAKRTSPQKATALMTSPTNSVAIKKVVSKSTADTNNNAKQTRTLWAKKTDSKAKNLLSKDSPKQTITIGKRTVNKNFSFRVLEDKKSQNNLDVYEFTFDPTEEPPPQKKKRKRVVRKKPTKPKTVEIKSNYDKNLSKALTALKSVVAKKPIQIQVDSTNTTAPKVQTSVPSNKDNLAAIAKSNDTANITEKNHVSIPIEDIAADFEITMDQPDINYSPVSTPDRPNTPAIQPIQNQTLEKPPVHKDPLNLQDNLSFFDDNPVASSSMNVSVRNPLASPWRVDFGNLPIRWQVNSYVKPNMIPAVECSFINIDDTRKKHVYTNIVPEGNNSLPEIVESSAPNMKQTSIISFIKEMAEKSANKKNKGAATPTKSSYIFDDISANTANKNTPSKSPKKVMPARKCTEKNAVPHNTDEDNTSKGSMTENTSNKENSRDNLKRKNDSDPNVVPAKTPRKDKDNTYFGFDDSEDLDQENVSPKKSKQRGLRARARAVLKEINKPSGPLRAILPVSIKSKALLEADKVFDDMKSASDAPVFPETVGTEIQCTNIDEIVPDDDSQSVHLFEDIEVVHHLKPSRKSYGKAKKVMFRANSSGSDSEIQGPTVRGDQVNSSDEDDLADLTFEMPNIKQKKNTKKKMSKKQKLSKKEKAEADAWAAGFNSMCEDIEEFPLIVE